MDATKADEIPWRPSLVTAPPPALDYADILPPQSNWVTRWLQAAAWTQLLIPIICLVLDALSDTVMPSDVPWTTSSPAFTNITLLYSYSGAACAYWSNIIVLLVGMFGVITYHHPFTLLRRTDNFLRLVHRHLCKITVIFCTIATFFAVWRWQVVSKAVTKNGDLELKRPFDFSIVTCFLQVFPGTASLFVPVLAVLAITESRDYLSPHKFGCNYRPDIPKEEIFVIEKQNYLTGTKGLFRSKPREPEACTMEDMADSMPEEDAIFLDPTVQKRKVSDASATASDLIRKIINKHMRTVLSERPGERDID